MAKVTKIYICSNCGTRYSKWLGKCSNCGEWNTIEEQIINKTDVKSNNLLTISPKLIQEINYDNFERISLPSDELNRILGGGLTRGSIILLAGEPGIGKTTLLMQELMKIKDFTVLYVSGEESLGQLKYRSERLGRPNSQFYLFHELSLPIIIQAIEEVVPDFVVIDSIQSISDPNLSGFTGSLQQIRECTSRLQEIAKVKNIPIFIIGHITKEGYIAGPKALEHIVDTVMHFEGDKNYGYRVLRVIKNRFGPAPELAIFEMTQDGLKEINNISEYLLETYKPDTPGSSIAVLMEGNRPILVEVQALVSYSPYGTPQRSSIGYDPHRLGMILAVLEKRLDLRVNNRDIFVNVTGGLRIYDPAIDSAVVAAILSSFNDKTLPHLLALSAEIGLNGELRSVSQLQKRIQEASKLGFKQLITANIKEKSFKNESFNSSINLKFINNISELAQVLFF
ncbi:MAG: DNA repair protein RadA [Bacteroidales bacterium]|jgi:DNA repair protein RadA/Sms|nr:DNA repair protein RadA [Bacteroidales bacterium]MDI9575068.1 DNA repair protein RadA [Bacteroidota bacterium]MDD3756171.1 DNA repair protein RadA [Bacteroidales bacterium]MDY0401629.1 DNA repair protein RadA [Bacteroidales bacterium]HOB78266.1 DNA repair protein RadA [Bacteroidales bacterium]